MSAPLVIEWVKRGDIVNAPAPYLAAGTEPMMVLSRCADMLAVFFCETCRCNLANIGQLEMHLEKGGSHRIAVWCSRHGVYEEPVAPATLQTGVAV